VRVRRSAHDEEVDLGDPRQLEPRERAGVDLQTMRAERAATSSPIAAVFPNIDS
jgi:hypothetical protein